MRLALLGFLFLVVFLIDARADLVDDQKATIARCEFAVQAARVPPSIPIKVICEKPFKMIEESEIVTVDCKEFCKVRGIK